MSKEREKMEVNKFVKFGNAIVEGQKNLTKLKLIECDKIHTIRSLERQKNLTHLVFDDELLKAEIRKNLIKYWNINEKLQEKFKIATKLADKNGFWLQFEQPRIASDVGHGSLYVKTSSGNPYIGFCDFVFMKNGFDFIYERDVEVFEGKIAKYFCAVNFGFKSFKGIDQKYECLDENVGCPIYRMETKEEFSAFLADLKECISPEKEEEMIENQKKNWEFVQKSMIASAETRESLASQMDSFEDLD